MPFTVPFNFHFAAGDLIYGLAPVRPRLVFHFGAEIINAGGPATVDQYRASSMQGLRKTDRTAWRQFLRDNEAHQKYSRYAQAIRGNENDEDRFATVVTSAILQNAAWRAKSKFGMEWTLRNHRGHIHFLLDDIEMGAVVTKTHHFVDAAGTVLAQDMPTGRSPAAVAKERTITHSELRWVYRNRGNPLVQAGVQFWRTVGGVLQPCVPPWTNIAAMTTLPSGAVVTWRHAWFLYRPTTERNVF
nr:hypothetical protein [uncultured Pseudomonas sp.]